MGEHLGIAGGLRRELLGRERHLCRSWTPVSKVECSEGGKFCECVLCGLSTSKVRWTGMTMPTMMRSPTTRASVCFIAGAPMGACGGSRRWERVASVST